MSENRKSKSWWLMPLITMGIVTASIVVASEPALADSNATTGSMSNDNVVAYWGTPRTDSKSKNLDEFNLTSITTLAGGYFTIAERNPAGSSFARVNITQLNTWYSIRNDNGNYWQPAGTFYTNTEVTGMVGGNGTGQINFAGTILWNQQY